MDELTWCEIERGALKSNVRQLRQVIDHGPVLAPVVKANAYGHGLELAADAFVEGGADWLCVNALFEAERLRHAGIGVPIYVLGYVAAADMPTAIDLECDVVVYDPDVAHAASVSAEAAGKGPARLHLKLETGNNRQGLAEDDALRLARTIHADPNLDLAGLSTHFADVEDTTDHTFANLQQERFQRFVKRLAAEGMAARRLHMSNSAAAILWPAVHLDLVRVGIACFGMWPSTESYVSAVVAGRATLHLTPAMSWKTRVVQVKEVPAGDYVGYGRTYRATHGTRLAILPVGYYDGYDRSLSNLAHVLIRGHRAPIRGRVCMNIVAVDTTHIPGVSPGDEVVLLGTQGDETITAEQIAGWAGTINYEVTTRINERIPRLAV